MNLPNPKEIPSASVQRHIDLLVLAMGLAISAGEKVRQWRTVHVGAMGGPIGVGDLLGAKTTSTDLVTAADKAIEEWLVQQIRQHRPGDRILGEEGGERASESEHTEFEQSETVRWIIDPIDGTVNFVLGIPHYAVSIAVEVDGQSQMGCVINAGTQTLYWAAAGSGAWMAPVSTVESSGQLSDAMELAGRYAHEPHLHGRRLQGPRSIELRAAVIGTGFGYNRERRGRQAAIVANLLPRVADIRRLGAASLDLCGVAAGTLDGYYEAGLSPWDFAAGVLIAQEAGCDSSGLRGRRCSSQFTAVAGPAFATDLYTLLEELDADLP